MVDNEAVVLSLKAWLSECSANGKRSFGFPELIERITKLEVDHRLPEGQELYDDRPMPVDPRSAHDGPVPAGSGSSR